MNYKAMQDRVIRYCSNREDLRTLVKEVINERQASLCTPFYFDALLETGTYNTVADTEDVTLDADVAVVRAVYDVDNARTLEYKEPEKYVTLNASTDYAGQPTMFTHMGGVLKLNVVPDDVYELRVLYQRFAEALSGDTDTSELPEDWHPIIVKLSASEMHSILGNTNRSQELKNEALGEINARVENRTASRRGKTGTVTIQRRS